MASFGGLNYMDFRGKERLAQDDDEPLATVEPLQYAVGEPPIVVAHTGITRNSGVVHRSIRERWSAGESAVVEGYLRIAQLARLGKKAILNCHWDTLGALMNENHEIQRTLGGSGPQNDHLIDVAMKNGALGAKLAGAGQRGDNCRSHARVGPHRTCPQRGGSRAHPLAETVRRRMCGNLLASNPPRFGRWRLVPSNLANGPFRYHFASSGSRLGNLFHLISYWMSWNTENRRLSERCLLSQRRL